MKTIEICTHEGCDRPIRCKGLCRNHYEKSLRGPRVVEPKDTTASRLRDAVLRCYEKHKGEGMLPTSCRFIFYELEAAGVVPKKYPDREDGKPASRTPAQDISCALTYWRERGAIPWADIKDETRSLTRWDRVPVSVMDGVRSASQDTRISFWFPVPAPMILCESRSLAGVLDDLAYEYQCSIAPTNGQCGGFLHTDIIPALVPGQRVLYMGDLDFVGGQIEANTRHVLENDLGPLQWERVVLTDVQAKAASLTPIHKRDERNGEYHDAIETEALGQGVIIALLRARLAELMPDDVRDAVQVRACTERDAIQKAITGVIG